MLCSDYAMSLCNTDVLLKLTGQCETMAITWPAISTVNNYLFDILDDLEVWIIYSTSKKNCKVYCVWRNVTFLKIYCEFKELNVNFECTPMLPYQKLLLIEVHCYQRKLAYISYFYSLLLPANITAIICWYCYYHFTAITQYHVTIKWGMHHTGASQFC